MKQYEEMIGIENIYYQDESGVDEYHTRRHGYAPIGQVINLEVSGKRYERQSIMAVRNHQHMLVEPMIYQGTADSNVVYTYFEKLLPTLKQGSIIAMDNASYHKSTHLLKLFLKHKVSIVYLPAYSPDLNPIENIWGTIKQHLRNYYDYTLTLFEKLCNAVNYYSV